jgi:methylmalonyl-CoA/ethylmalonyl-CoA epimerase
MIETKDIFFELVSGEVVKNFNEKNTTYYHICYEVDDIYKTIEEMDGILVSPPKKAVLFNNRKVCFMMTNIGLIEFLEK